MKIRKLTVAGFGPFKTEQVVDFTAFDAEGLFLIVGQTGAGKSSILDAITYALYGNTPRWTDTNITKKNSSVRSDYNSPDEKTSVSLEFSEKSTIFKIERSIKLVSNGQKEKESCKFFHWLDNDWAPLAEGLNDTESAITKHVGLTESEFLQVILLAQGRFDKALKASSTERLELMRTLFKTEKFEKYKNGLKSIAEAASSALATAEAGIKTEQNVLVGALAMEQDFDFDFKRDVPVAITKLKAELKQIDSDKKEAEDTLTAATSTLDLAKAQTELNNALAALEALKKLEPEIAATQEQVDSANRAAKVEVLINNWQEAESARSEADQLLSDARKNFTYETKDAQLKTRRDVLVALQAKLEENLELADKLAEQNVASWQFAGELAGFEAELAALGEQIDALKAERQSLHNLAAEVQPRTEIRDAAQAVFDKSKELQDATKGLQTLEGAEKLASQENATAATAYLDVLKAYNDLAAARLAEALKPGEACLVCGSTTHPAKHSSIAQGSVDEKKLEAANKASRTATANLATATEQLKAGQDLVSGLQKLVGEQKHSAVEAALKKASADLNEAKKAQVRVKEISSQIDGDDAPLAKERNEVSGKATDAKTGLAAANNEVKRIGKELQTLLAGQPSVADYLEATKTELTKTEALTGAIEAADSASKNLAKALKIAESKTKEQKFDSLKGVAAAILEPKVLEGLQTRIEEHKSDVASQKGILALPRLQNLPKYLPSQEIAQQSVETALATASTIAEVAGGLREKVAAAEELFGNIQAQVNELSAISSDAELKTRLHQTFDGRTPNTKNMPLEVYFMAAELESVLEAANLRLKTLSRGRFSLLHTDRGVGRANTQAGLGIEVMDENTGKPFDPHRFSGGETFLASLALALGLAEVVTSRNGGIKIDTLFVDEGFGTLDGEPLEDAMSILESLKSGGRTVGLISHVESLKERIPTQLKVNKTPNGPSIIQQ
ncbi:MAG: hypothetical protein RL196_299 [Actinomycetota bacterium]|jgi:exonuclease SbcC